MAERYKDADPIEKARQIYKAAIANGNRYPLIPVAQAVLESGWFKKESGKNNFFGQKATKSQPGRGVQTKEEINGKLVPMEQRFRDYSSIEEGLQDHFKKWQGVYNEAETLDTALAQLAPRYATDSQYANKIKNVISSLKKRGIGTQDVYALDEKNQIVNVNPAVVTEKQKQDSPTVKAFFDAGTQKQVDELKFQNDVIEGKLNEKEEPQQIEFPQQQQGETVQKQPRPIAQFDNSAYEVFTPNENEFLQYFLNDETT